MPKDEGLAEQKRRLSMDLATLLYASVNATDRRVSKRSRRLTASERCRALLQEGGDPLAGVGCARDVCDGPRLVLHLGLQRLRPAAVQQPLGGPERLCRAGGELRGKSGSLLHQVLVRYDAGDDAPLEGFLGGQLPAGEGELRRPPQAHQ